MLDQLVIKKEKILIITKTKIFKSVLYFAHKSDSRWMKDLNMTQQNLKYIEKIEYSYDTRIERIFKHKRTNHKEKEKNY